MSTEEAERFLRFMKFPNLLDVDDYRKLLDDCGCRVETAQDTGRFASHVDLYLNMLNMQLTYDALKRIGFDMELSASPGRGNGLHPATRTREQDLPRTVRSQQDVTESLLATARQVTPP